MAAESRGMSGAMSRALARAVMDRDSIDHAVSNVTAAVQNWHAMGGTFINDKGDTVFQDFHQAEASIGLLLSDAMNSPAGYARAIHLAQDIATPGHRGKPFENIFLNPIDSIIHGYGDFFPSDQTEQLAYQNTLNVMEAFATGAEIGMILCEDASGNKVVCSGSVEETVLGVITSAPYITVNKPADASASKFVFSAKVSESNGEIVKGDYLKAVEGGNFGKCSKEEIPFAYAIALDDASGKDRIRVKIIK